MPMMRENMTTSFEHLGYGIYRHHRIIIATALMLLCLAAWQLPKLTFDTSTEGFLHKDSEELKTYDKFRHQFGRDDLILIASDPPDVFDLAFLDKLKALHQDLKANVPYVDDITSLVNARHTYGDGDTLKVEDLLTDWPQDAESLAKFKKDAMSNEFYRNLLLSEDGRFTAIVIKTSPYAYEAPQDDLLDGFDEIEAGFATAAQSHRKLTDKENSAIVDAVSRIVEAHQTDSFPLYVAGPPVVALTLKQMMRADIRVFVVLTIATIAIVLFVLFRRFNAIVLPLIVVACSLISTLGLMAFFGVPIKSATQILPSLLLAVGVADSVHILAQYYRRLGESESKADAIAHAIGHSALPVILTSITTAAGLASFAGAEVAPVADLGVFSSLGVLFALLYSILLLPAMLALLPGSKRPRSAGKAQNNWIDYALVRTANFSVDHARSIIVVSTFVILGALLAATNLRFSHNPLTWLPPDMPVRQATELLDKELKGTISVEVVLDTGVENGLQDPEFLHALDATGAALSGLTEGDIQVGKTWSLADILKEIHQALNENDPEYYRIPAARDLIAQELLLFENTGNDDLRDVVDSLFTEARLTVRVPWVDAVQYPSLLDRVAAIVGEHLKGQAEITITGIMVLLARTIDATMITAATSYIVAFAIITLLMILIVRRVGLGLISMVPNVLPVLASLAVMWLVGIPLDMFTILIGSIAIGLAVDDTIHVLHQFDRYHKQTGSTREAVLLTFQTTGRALLITTIVLAMGFFVFMFATMHNLINFGFLTGFTILVALVADFLLLPALLTVITDDKREASA